MTIVSLFNLAASLRRVPGSLIGAALVAVAACSDPVVAPSSSTVDVPASRISLPNAGNFSGFGMGNRGYCALAANGEASCVGNLLGEAELSRHTASDGGTFVRIAGESMFYCALTSLGGADCWGRLPWLTTRDLPTRLVASQGRLVAIHGLCGLRDDGAIECFDPVLAAPASRKTYVASSGQFTRPLYNSQYGGCGLRSDGSIECMDPRTEFYPDLPPLFTAASGRFVEADANGNRLCGLREDGVMECWSRIDVKDAPLIHETFIAAGGGRFTSISADGECGLRTDGRIECSGTFNDQQAGPRPSSNGLPFVEVRSQNSENCGRRSDGAIECWGTFASDEFLVRPIATFNVPSFLIKGTTYTMSLTGAALPGYPEETAFKFAFPLCTSSAPPSTVNSVTCAVPDAAEVTLRGVVYDRFGDQRVYDVRVSVRTPAEATTDLRTLISASTLQPDLRRPLTAKLNAAIAAIEAGDIPRACSALADFINQVRAQRGKAIATSTADAWIIQANDLRNAIGC